MRVKVAELKTQEKLLWEHTHGAEITRAAELSLVPTVQQHLLQLVSQPIQQLLHGWLRIPGRRKEVVEVQNSRQGIPGRLASCALAAFIPQRHERLFSCRGKLPVSPQET